MTEMAPVEMAYEILTLSDPAPRTLAQILGAIRHCYARTPEASALLGALEADERFASDDGGFWLKPECRREGNFSYLDPRLFG